VTTIGTFTFLSVNSSQEVPFLGHHIVAMLENIVSTLGE